MALSVRGGDAGAVSPRWLLGALPKRPQGGFGREPRPLALRQLQSHHWAAGEGSPVTTATQVVTGPAAHATGTFWARGPHVRNG